MDRTGFCPGGWGSRWGRGASYPGKREKPRTLKWPLISACAPGHHRPWLYLKYPGVVEGQVGAGGGRAEVLTCGEGHSGVCVTWRRVPPWRPRPGERSTCLSPDDPVHLRGQQPLFPGWQSPRTLSSPAHLENGASGSMGPRGLRAAGLAATETPLGGGRLGSKAQGLAGGLSWQLPLPSQSCSPWGQFQDPSGDPQPKTVVAQG